MKKLSKFVGLYGGTFNPVHLGHLNLAVEMLEAHGLDQIMFCPARLSPHKLDDKPIPAEHRVNMLKLAIKDVPQFSILDVELHRSGPSYTIDTVEYLLAEERKSPHPRQFCLIIGDDSLAEFHRWHRVEDLIKLVPLLVGRRSSNPDLEHIQSSPALRKAIQKGYTNTKVFDVSSTEVRKRLKQQKYCGHLVPEKVLDYIYTNDLY